MGGKLKGDVKVPYSHRRDSRDDSEGYEISAKVRDTFTVYCLQFAVYYLLRLYSRPTFLLFPLFALLSYFSL